MATHILKTCPLCGEQVQSGFAARAAGLSFVDPHKFKQFVFLDEDLGKAGWTKLLPSRAEYFRSYLCRECKFYMVDYSAALRRHEAEAEQLAGVG